MVYWKIIRAANLSLLPRGLKCNQYKRLQVLDHILNSEGIWL